MTPYSTPGAFRVAIESRLRNQAASEGGLVRLRRRLVFERILVRLETANRGLWVLKGGMAMELRLQDRARATKDLDLALREAAVAGESVRALIAEALSEDPDGDWFEFRIKEGRPLTVDEAGRPGWRFPIEAGLDGRAFANVSVDVVARVEEIAGTERIPLPGILGFAALPAHEVEVVDRNQHFAEKLHALVWFQDIVDTCLATSLTPRTEGVGDVVGSARGGGGQGAGADQVGGGPGLPGLQAVGPRAREAIRRRR
jgi:hypothetical protein